MMENLSVCQKARFDDKNCQSHLEQFSCFSMKNAKAKKYKEMLIKSEHLFFLWHSTLFQFLKKWVSIELTVENLIYQYCNFQWGITVNTIKALDNAETEKHLLLLYNVNSILFELNTFNFVFTGLLSGSKWGFSQYLLIYGRGYRPVYVYC